MSHFDAYRDSFPNARLTRSGTEIWRWRFTPMAAHSPSTDTLMNSSSTYFTRSADRDNRVVILTGSGNAFMETISPEGFDFFTPQGYNKISREGRKNLMNILDIEVPLIAAVNPRAAALRVHSAR